MDVSKSSWLSVGGVVEAQAITRLRMSWEEYCELPARPRNEWVDGEVLVMAPTSVDHGSVVVRLGALLLGHLPDRVVSTEGGLWLPRNRLRAPDLMVLAELPEGRFTTAAPLLCVEVLSPSTRSEDTVRKAMEYAEGGVDRYWIVDRELRAIEVLRNVDGAWKSELHLDEAHPTATAEVDGVPIPLDLTALLGPRR